jgi:hypothetical protein
MRRDRISVDLEIVKLIKTTLQLLGDGTDGNPYRKCEQYWDMDGTILIEYDPWTQETKWLNR